MYCTREGGGEKKRERRGDSEETLEERQIEEGRDRRTKKTEGETIETGGRRERKTQKKKNREECYDPSLLLGKSG